MPSQNPEQIVSEERRVLTLTGPTPAFTSMGPLTIEQMQVKLSCIDALWEVLRDGAPKYANSPVVPRLNPVLISYLASFGASEATRVLRQVHDEVANLCAKYIAPEHLQGRTEKLLGVIITDVGSRVDHILYEKTYRALESGAVIEGASLEPVRYVDDEEEAIFAHVATKNGAQVIEFPLVMIQRPAFPITASPASFPDAQEA